MRISDRSSDVCSSELQPVEKYLFALGIVTVLTLAAKNLVRSNPGRQWMAIRDMDIAAEIIGIRPVVAKLSAFAVSSFFVGIAGALYLFVYLGSAQPSSDERPVGNLWFSSCRSRWCPFP